MEIPKFEPTTPPIKRGGSDVLPTTPTPPTPPAAETAAALQQEGVDRQRAAAEEMQVLLGKLKDDCDRLGAELAAAKAILRDLVAAGVLTDGFMTHAVGQSLLNQAAAAAKFLKDHP